MKLLLILFLLGMSLTASAMGHPHNLFSAHRKARQWSQKAMAQPQFNSKVCKSTRPFSLSAKIS